MHTVTDIDGIVVARAVVSSDSASLSLHAPSGFTTQADGRATYYPAESLSFTSIEGVRALRDLCQEMLEQHRILGGGV